ncbi:MAG: hypothetical protein UE295_00405 [Acutalibacteraceae bacterium]|nr:hypothetical protein [Acutalibacteraceae bacterium]
MRIIIKEQADTKCLWIIKKGGVDIKIIRELSVFSRHYDWYTKDENGFYVPTEKAPEEAVEAMNYCNELAKKDIENDIHII